MVNATALEVEVEALVVVVVVTGAAGVVEADLLAVALPGQFETEGPQETTVISVVEVTVLVRATAALATLAIKATEATEKRILILFEDFERWMV